MYLYPAKLNKRERKAQQLLAHYATCERITTYLGVTNPNGKKISVALWKLERMASDGATAYCNGEIEEQTWNHMQSHIRTGISTVFKTIPPGFFVNGDPRGYSLQVDCDDADGKKLIEACGLHKNWGGNGVLSPTIDGD